MCTIRLKTEENLIKFRNSCCTETKLLQNKITTLVLLTTIGINHLMVLLTTTGIINNNLAFGTGIITC